MYLGNFPFWTKCYLGISKNRFKWDRMSLEFSRQDIDKEFLNFFFTR